MTSKIVLTGGPGTGKSSIILGLEALGEYVIREAAEDHIKLMQAQGQPRPCDEENFQDKILELQLQRESRIPKEAQRVFIDRGIPDGLAYTKPGADTYKKILEASNKSHYNKVFLIGTLGHTERTDVRRETDQEARRIGDQLNRVYENLGYRITNIGGEILNLRVDDILRESRDIL